MLYFVSQVSINKQEDTKAVEYYSSLKNNEILQLATAWMDLEGIMLTDISQL